MKENILVVFGGKSAEHDISIITGLQTISNIDREKYNVVPMYISKNNQFFVGERLCYLSTYMPFNSNVKGLYNASLIPGSDFLFSNKKAKKIYFLGETNQTVKNSYEYEDFNNKKFVKLLKIDCAVICCHGKSGEDGSIQGLLEICGIPYTSSGVVSSSVCMDKIFMKQILIANGYKTPNYTYFEKTEYILNSEEIYKKVEALGYPVFVKPANLGSSIGISKCYNQAELQEAIDIAINFDRKILVEKSIENNMEINCAVFGNSSYTLASDIETPLHKNSFLTFDEKYIQRQDNLTKLEKHAIEEKLEGDIKNTSQRLFKDFDCKGVVRIDYLFDKDDGTLYVNELNSIPGSMAFYLFKDKMDFKTFLDKLISNAKKEYLQNNKLNINFSSSALNHFNSGLKSNKYTNN